ncbi:MAG: hypothetical protein AAB880_00565 [Patescibacteria group bacterium]
MENGSLSRRQMVIGGGLLAGVGLLLEACGDYPLGPGRASAKAVDSGLVRRLQIRQAFTVPSVRPISPLQALQTSRRSYQTVPLKEGLFVTAINGQNEPWIFLVDNIVPDLSGASRLTRLGKVDITSVAEAQRQLPRFRGGTVGLSFAADDPGAAAPTVETVFAPASGQTQVLISWLQVGLMQPDVV